MRVFYKEGFMILKSGRAGPVFIAPHSSTSLLSLIRGDVWTELITARLVRRLGGIGFVSTVPRKGKYGIDLFRKQATMEEAIEMFKVENDYQARLEFEEKYAFFARDEEEYLEKANVYNQFWTSVKTLSPRNSLFVIVHTQGMELKNFPSLLDVATLNGEWASENKIREAVEKITHKNKILFESLKPDIKYYALEWAKAWLKGALTYRFGNFDLKKLYGAFRVQIRDDIKKAAGILNMNLDDLFSNISWEKYMELIEKSVDNSEFRITYQNVFNGSRGRESIGSLLEHRGGEAVLVETSAFLNELYPKISIKLVQELINEVVRKEKLQRFEKFLIRDNKEQPAQ